MVKSIDLVQIVDNGNGTQTLIAECNVYEDNVRVAQLSRSIFTFPDSMSVEQIVEHLWANQYSIYA